MNNQRVFFLKLLPDLCVRYKNMELGTIPDTYFSFFIDITTRSTRKEIESRQKTRIQLRKSGTLKLNLDPGGMKFLTMK